jgi:hypothetical protein
MSPIAPATPTSADTQASTPLSQVLAEIAAKRAVDLMRFRTCCVDPRASK